MSSPAASILVVDDVPDNLQVLSDILGREGFTVRPVAGATMALRTIERALPDLILADIKMPGMDGYELCRRLKSDERTRGIPVIFISALGETKDKLRAFDAGGVDYVTKPFQADEVVARVRTHLVLNELRRSLQQANRELESRVERRTEELARNLHRLHEELAERRRTEEKLKATADHLELALEAAHAGWWEWDLGTNENRWSQEIFRLYDLDPARTRPSYDAWRASIHPDDLEAVETAVAAAVRGEADVNVAWRVRTSDGSERRLFSRGRSQRGPDGRPTRYLGAVVDVTERLQAEEQLRTLNLELEARVAERTVQLEATNRELEAFSYSVSHDLRAPLRAIEGFSAMVVKDHSEALDPEARRLLGVVRTNAQRMSALIDDLLRFSRATRGEILHGRLEMTAVARSAFEEVTGDAEARGRIDFRLGELPPAEGDPTLIRQVWLNLLSNAVKFSKGLERPVITVEGAREGSSAVYHVRDDGAGFEMKHSDKLFGVFQRLHGAREFEGTGIGLALVKRIVERHGGRVWADGEVGKGATFSFSLPAADRPGADARDS